MRYCAHLVRQAHYKTCEQLDGIAKTYQQNDVTVHRLRPYTEPEKSYLGSLQQGYSQLYPADPVFVIGHHFMELNIRRAYRRKEVFPIRAIVLPMIEDGRSLILNGHIDGSPLGRWICGNAHRLRHGLKTIGYMVAAVAT